MTLNIVYRRLILLLISIFLIYGSHAQITQVGTQTSTFVSSGQSFEVNRPAGVQAGDLLILNVARELGGNSSDITVNNSGWVQLGQTGLSGTTDFRGAVFYKIATAFEPGSYVVVPAAWASVSRAGGAIVAFRGVDTENPIDIQGLITSVPNTTNTIALSPISTTVANTLVVQVGMNIRTENGTRSFTGWNTVNPGALTAVYNLASTNPIRTRLGLATRLKPNIGTTGNSSIVVNGNSNKAGIMFALRPEQPRHFRTRVNWGDFNAASTWDKSLDGLNWVASDRIPNSDDLSVLIQSIHTTNLNTSVSVSNLQVDGTLNVNGSSITLTATNAIINGLLKVENTASFTGTGILFNAGSTYEHAVNGGTIPTATWDVNSTCLITGITNTLPLNSSLNQAFGNFTWQCYNQNANLSFATALSTVNGNLTVVSTGSSGAINLMFSGPSTYTTNVGGNFVQSGGIFRVAGDLGGTTAFKTLNIAGDFIISGGTFDLHASTNYAGSGTVNVDGNVNISGWATITETGIGAANFNFTGTNPARTFTKTSGTISNTVSFNVVTGATVDFGTSVLDNSWNADCNFNVSTGATIITANTNTTGALTLSGNNGTIQVSGSRIYSTSANYVFNGSGVQYTGNGLIGAANLTLNNSGTHVTNNINIAGSLNLQSGIVYTSTANLITILNTNSNAITGATANRYIAGPLRWYLPPNYNGAAAYLFPIGSPTGYYPLVFNNPTTGSGTIILQAELKEQNASGTAGPDISAMSTTEYWSLVTTGNFTNSTISATRPGSPGIFNSIAASTTQSGQFNSLNGSISGNSITNSDPIGSNRFFVFAQKGTPPPSISVSTNSITNFQYVEENGPSNIVAFTVSGSNLISNITIQASSNFEVSALGGAAFSPVSVLNIPAFGGSVNNASVFVRMKAGLSLGNVSPQILNVTAIDAIGLQVSVSGVVTVRPEISFSPASLSGFNYLFPGGPSTQQSFVVSGTNLAGNVVLTAPSNYEISLSSNSGYVSTSLSLTPVGGNLNTTVYARLKSNLGVGAYNESVTAGSLYAETKSLTLSGSVTSAPTILLSKSFLPTFIYTLGSGPSGVQSFVASGHNLVGNVTLTAPANYQISTLPGSGFGNTITLTPSGGVVNSTIYVRMISGLAVNTYGPVNLAVSSSGALTKNVALRGSVVGSTSPTILVSTNVLNSFGYLVNNGPSNTQTLTVSGASLGADITITPPSNYEISLSQNSGFVSTPIVLTRVSQRVNPTDIYVRLKADLPPGDYNQTMTIVSGAVSNPVNILGKVFASPLIAAAGGGDYCTGSTINLLSTGDDIMNRYWVGPNNFYSIQQNPSIPNSTPTLSGEYTVTGNVVIGGNLVVNGDFELGDVGFSSAYERPPLPLTTSSLVPEGRYAVVDLPSQVHNNFSSTAVDHTPAPGTKQMVINGNVQVGAVVWSQSVPVIPHAYYEFNYWVQTVVNGNDPSPSRLQLYVNGVAAGPVYTANPTTGVWTQFIYNTYAGVNNMLNLELINQNTIAGGNDFALDDIVFQQILPASASTNIQVNNSLPVSVSILYSPTTIYQNTPVQYNALGVNAGDAPVYVWKVNGVPMGSNSSSFIYTPIDGDVISVELNSSYPCATNNPATSTETMTVLVLTNYWMGSVSSNWGDENNWTAGFVPVTGDNVEYATLANYGSVAERDLVLDINRTIGSLVNQTNRRLIVPEGKALIVNNIISTDGNPDRIWIKADSLSANGTLIFNNPQNLPVSASVEMYSKASFDLSQEPGNRYNWQFFGIPLRSMNAMPALQSSFVRRKVEWGTTIFNHWIPLTNDSVLRPFVGYEISQQSPKFYAFRGELVNSNFNSGILPVTPEAIYPGQHLLANPYTAAIDIRQINFGSGMDNSVFLYNTGTFAAWEEASETPGDAPGTYVVIPRNLAGMGQIPRQVPSMSSMLVKVNTPGSGAFVNIAYNDVVMRNDEMQRVKALDNEIDFLISNIRIEIEGANTFDKMWLFSGDNFTRSYDNGYDGRKIIGSTRQVQIFAVENDGIYQVNAVDHIHNTNLAYIPGNESVLRLRFVHENTQNRYDKIFLHDLFTNNVVDVTENETVYQFSTQQGNTPLSRFRILTTEQTVDVGENRIKTVQNAESLYVYNLYNSEAKLYVYDVSGKLVSVSDLNSLSMNALRLNATGVYVLKVVYSDQTVNLKVLKD